MPRPEGLAILRKRARLKATKEVAFYTPQKLFFAQEMG
jgi:hypothetical protein